MAESDAHAIRGFSGAAVETELSAGISAAATTISCSDLSSWTAADDAGPGRATITDGTSEEEIEFTAVSSNNLTGCTRGVGGTSAREWDAGTTISHGASVRDFIEANRVVNRVLGVASVAAGDLYYVSSVSTGPVFSRLAKGTAGQVLKMNSGATAPEWVTPGANVLGSAHVTASQTGIGTSFTALTSTSLTVTVPAAGALIQGAVYAQKKTGAGYVNVRLRDTTAGANVGIAAAVDGAIDDFVVIPILGTHAPGAGSRTYRIEVAAENNTVDVFESVLIITARMA